MIESEATEITCWMMRLFPSANAELVIFIQKRILEFTPAVTRACIEDHRASEDFLNPAKLLASIQYRSAPVTATERLSAAIREAKERESALHREQAEIDAHWKLVKQFIASMTDSELSAVTAEVLGGLTELQRGYLKSDNPKNCRMLAAMVYDRANTVEA